MSSLTSRYLRVLSLVKFSRVSTFYTFVSFFNSLRNVRATVTKNWTWAAELIVSCFNFAEPLAWFFLQALYALHDSPVATGYSAMTFPF